VFLIAAPAHGDADHLTLLTALARALVRPEFVASLRAAGSPADVVRLVQEVVSPEPAAAPAAVGATATSAGATPPSTAAGNGAGTGAAGARRSLVVVSACPTGIAHTYMAADKLTAAGQAAGVDIHVETQGSSGSTPLDPAVIRAADAVIFAVDVGVRDRDRFAGKPLVQSGTKRAINEPDVMVREALAAADDPNARRVPGGAGGAAEPAAATGDRPGAGHGDPPLAAHRRQLHDPVRRRGRSAHRPGLPLRRLPDRQPRPVLGRRQQLRPELGAEQHLLQPAGRRSPRGPQRRLLGLPRRGLHRAGPGGLRVPGPGAGRLHRLRDRRPPGIVPGFVVGFVSVRWAPASSAA
jgi:fructose-specific phosphotransferase system IIB component